MTTWEMRPSESGAPDPLWAETFGISPLLLDIIWNRGFKTEEAIGRYIDAPLKSLTPPDNWPQITTAANILADNLLAGKKLAVWGDYDVDGITATTLVLDLLEFHGFQVLHHLPDRRAEGYGLNIPHIERLAKLGCETLLTVDCGISDVEAIARARELGLTVVVSDHHVPPAQLPPANAFVNPRMEADKPWPFQGLAGVGVAFYLMARVNQLLSPATGKKYSMRNALDLVCLGTLADVMPLRDENRILARGGLNALREPARPGFAALKIVAGLDMNGQIDSGQAVFRLAPRLNSAGRMGAPDTALQLLRATDYGSAEALAAELDAQNTARKNEEARIFREARQQALELLENGSWPGLVLYGDDWHPGIIGIAASRVVEEFERPAIVLCGDGDMLKGSGRSWANFDLYGGLAACREYLANFGGHKMAAGLSLGPENLEKFRQAFAAAVGDGLGFAPVPRVLKLERELSFAQVNEPHFVAELSLLQPFGPENPEPLFLSKPLILRKRSPLGRTGEHLLLELEEEESGRKMSAKAWRMASLLPERTTGQKIRIVFTPRLDTWNGFPSIDLGIKDWKLA